MPKKKKESQKDQSKRFLEKVQELEDAGELNPTEAEEKFERAMEKIAPKRPSL
jgi:guanylate kinase